MNHELVKENEEKEKLVWEMKKAVDEYREFIENLASLAKEGSGYEHFVTVRPSVKNRNTSPFSDWLQHEIYLTLIKDEEFRDRGQIHEFTVTAYSINDNREICTAKAEAYRECGKMRLDTLVTEKEARRKGFGCDMLRFLKKFCKSNGIREIYGTIGTSPNMQETKLRSFYVKNGFAFDGPRFSYQL